MFEFFRGRVHERHAATLSLDVGGVGYSFVTAPGLSFPGAPRQGDELTVWAHLHVREDAHVLYGFPDRDTRELFRVLLRVRGVGPTMALGILSGLPRRALVEALLQKDPRPLVKVKGVGKKTAEQILLDLADRTALLADPGSASAPAADQTLPAPGGPDQANIEDAVAALVSVGYSDKEGRKLVERAARTVDPADLEQLVRVALRG